MSEQYENEDENKFAEDGWPSRAQVLEVYDADEAHQRAMAEVSADDVYSWLRSMSEHPLRWALQAVKLPPGSHLNRGVASALRNQLCRQGPSGLVAALTSSVQALLRDVTDDAEQWRRLAAGEPCDLTMHEGTEWELQVSEFIYLRAAATSGKIVRLGLVAALLRTGNPVMALWFLSAYEDEAADAFARLYNRFPSIPEGPGRALDDFPDPFVDDDAEDEENVEEDAADGGAGTIGDTDDTGDSATVAAEQREEQVADTTSDAATNTKREIVGDPTSAGVGEPGSGSAAVEDDGGLTALVESLDWELALNTALSVASTLDEQSTPDAAAVAFLSSFTDTAAQVAARLSTRTGTAVAATAAAMSQAVQAIEVVAGDQTALRRLLGLHGPTQFAEAIAHVRQLAADELECSTDQALRDGLVALHGLAVACVDRKAGADVDFRQIGNWDAAARAGLPTTAHAAILAASLGDLEFAAVRELGTSESTMTAQADDDAPVDTAGTSASAALAGDDKPQEDEVEDLDDAPAAETPDAAHPEPETADLETVSAIDSDAASVVTETEEADENARPDDDATDSGNSKDTADAAEIEGSEGSTDLEDLEALLRRDLQVARGSVRITEENDSTQTGTPASADVNTRGDDAVAQTEPEHESYDPRYALEATLVSTGRYGLASWLHQNPAHCGARQLAAYQQHLTQPAGQLTAAFSEAAGYVTRDALSDDRPGQLLAWASAARVAIVAPASGAAALLTELTPCFTDHPALVTVGQAFTQAALAGAFALPELAGAISAIDDAETDAADASEAARALVSGARRRKLKYTPANGVYQSWMEPAGPLGTLLRTAAEGDHTDTPDLLAAVTRLRGEAEAFVDTTFSAQRKRSRKDKIVGGSRSTLVTLWEDALDLAASWAQSTQAAHERSARLREGSARASRPLETLRRALADVRDDALADLEDLKTKPLAAGGQDAPRAAAESAAAGAALGMLMAAFATTDGHPPTGAEPTPAWAANHELLAAPLALEPATFEPVEDLDRIALAEQLAEHPYDAAAAYALRSGRREHNLTWALVENQAAVAPAEAAELRSRRDSDVESEVDELRTRLREVKSMVRAHQRDATVPMDVATTMLATVAAIRPGSRTDFAHAHADLDALVDSLRRHHADQVAEAAAQIDAAAETNKAVAAHVDLLRGMAGAGQVAGALEYLEQLVTTGKLPEVRDGGAHFARFYPGVVHHATAHPALLAEVSAALHGEPATDAVARLAELAEVELENHSEGSRRVATTALGSWNNLTQRRNVDVVTVLHGVLALLGYEFKTTTGQLNRQQGRTWARLTDVSAVGQALVPALGSQMSKGGSTLRVLIVHQATSPATIIDWLREERVEETVVVLHPGGTFSVAERRALATAARGRPKPVTVVIDPAVMAYLAMQTQASRSTMAALTLPFTADSPYQDRAGRTAPEMFYGRSSERALVTNLEGPSFVSGGRQLGKSALLWSAKENFDDGRNHRAVMVEIRIVGAAGDPEQLWPRLHSALHDADILAAAEHGVEMTAETVTGAIREWLDADTDRRLLVLLDEADLFLDADAEGNQFRNIDAVKRLMDAKGRRVKFVFAGLHRVARFESLANQPLAHLGRQVTIGPLRAQAAYDLVTRPLAALGYAFAEDHAGPARILAFTNNVPSLLQLFGQALLRRLSGKDVADGPPLTITDDDINAVIEDTDLAEQFRNKYLLTLQLDHRYLVIVYAIAYNALAEEADLGLRLSQIEDAARTWWPEGFAGVTIDHLRGLVTECCDLGVLAHDQGRYRMRTQTMLRLLGTVETIEETLYDASERLQLPTSHDTTSYRAPMPPSANRSPLTARQVSQILSARGATFVVAGSAGTGIGWLAPALKNLEHTGAARGMKVVRPATSVTPDQLRGRGERVSTATLAVLDARHCSATRLRSLGDAAAEVTAAHPELTVVIAADQTSAPAWVGAENLIELTRVDNGGLRLWCDEVSAPFHTTEEQAELMTAAGGWPKLLVRVFEDHSEGAEARIATLTADLGKPDRARTLLTEAGVAGVTAPEAQGLEAAAVAAVLAAAFTAVADLTGGNVTGGADLDVLADLISETDMTVAGQPTTLAKATTDAGFGDLGQVLVALRACGALVTGPGGNVAAEPVLLAAAAVVAAQTGVGR